MLDNFVELGMRAESARKLERRIRGLAPDEQQRRIDRALRRKRWVPAGSATVAPRAATRTPPASLPDLVVAKAYIGRTTLVATIMNKGDGPANGTIVVSVLSNDGRTLLATTSAPNAGLAPHASVEVDTGYAVKGSQRPVVVVNPAGTIEESNTGNNSTAVAVVGG